MINSSGWEIAHNIAFELVERGTDPNEVGKVLAFLRQHEGDADAKQRLMILLQRMADSRIALIRSQQTQRFYQNIRDACQTHLGNISDPSELLEVLGWSIRLMRYYRVEPKRAVDEQRAPDVKTPKPERVKPLRSESLRPVPEPPRPSLIRSESLQAVPEPLRPEPMPQPQTPAPLVKIGERVPAIIQSKQGHKVTVKLQASHSEEVTFEQPYYPGQVGAKVRVKVQAIGSDGRVTKVIAG